MRDIYGLGQAQSLLQMSQVRKVSSFWATCDIPQKYHICPRDVTFVTCSMRIADYGLGKFAARSNLLPESSLTSAKRCDICTPFKACCLSCLSSLSLAKMMPYVRLSRLTSSCLSWGLGVSDSGKRGTNVSLNNCGLSSGKIVVNFDQLELAHWILPKWTCLC